MAGLGKVFADLRSNTGNLAFPEFNQLQSSQGKFLAESAAAFEDFQRAIGFSLRGAISQSKDALQSAICGYSAF